MMKQSLCKLWSILLLPILLTSCVKGTLITPEFTQKGAVLALGMSFDEILALSEQHDGLGGTLDLAFCEDELCKIVPNPSEHDWILEGSEADWTDDELRAALGEPFCAEENARIGVGRGLWCRSLPLRPARAKGRPSFQGG